MKFCEELTYFCRHAALLSENRLVILNQIAPYKNPVNFENVFMPAPPQFLRTTTEVFFKAVYDTFVLENALCSKRKGSFWNAAVYENKPKTGCGYSGYGGCKI